MVPRRSLEGLEEVGEKMRANEKVEKSEWNSSWVTPVGHSSIDMPLDVEF